MDPHTLAEGLAVVFNLAYVVLAIFQSVLCWLAGFLGAGLTLVVFLHARLYGATALQVVYMALMVYGWHEWRHGGETGGELNVSRTPTRWHLGLAAAGLAFAVGLGLFLKHATDAALPLWDAATTSFSLVAQFMTTRKWIESWLVWIAVDLVYVGMLVSQELSLMAVLYVGYLVLAVVGYVKWRRSLHEGQAAGGGLT
jgi:nicotinamide mononucleotide transporter